MLPIDRISHVATHESGWKKERRGKITASQFGRLVGEKAKKGIFTAGALSYLEELAYETITGEDYKREVFTDDIEWGNATQIEAVQYFLAQTGFSVLRDEDTWNTERLIVNDIYAATPDALIIIDPDRLFTSDGLSINVRTLEVKCNRKKFIKFFKCLTPAQLKKAEPDYYWQVICQMALCGAAVGYWATYHPDFPIKMRIIEFKQSEADVRESIADFNAICAHAKNELANVMNILTNGDK